MMTCYSPSRRNIICLKPRTLSRSQKAATDFAGSLPRLRCDCADTRPSLQRGLLETLEGIQSEGLRFETLSGTLTVKEAGSNALAIDFPAIETREIEPIPALEDALGVPVRSVRAAAQDPWQLIVVVDDQRTVEQCTPNFEALKTATPLCVAITAAGDDADFVSRFFAPHLGILEDPVTGSAHCQLAPMWAGMLDQTDLVARQLSERGGDLRCRVHDDRVELVGSCMRYAEGRLYLPK